MRDGAVYNQPLDDETFQSHESPMLEKQSKTILSSSSSSSYNTARGTPARNASSGSLGSLSRTSSRSRGANAGPATDGPAQQQKRLPRKLTKGRGNSDSAAEKGQAEKVNNSRATSDSTPSDRFSSDKLVDRTKGVLIKKASQPKTVDAAVDGEDGVENSATDPGRTSPK